MLLNKRISIGYFFRLIKWDLLVIFIYASLVGTLDHFAYFKNVSIPLGLSALVGTLLSLLLAFRTSQSYERWWEARVIWGGIVNDSRTLIRQLIEFLPKGETKEKYLKEFAIRQSIWCFALGESLRKSAHSTQVVEYCEQKGLSGSNLPNLFLTKHVESLAEMADFYDLNPIKLIQLDSTIQRITDSMGRCERIKSTIFPRSYSILIHFLIYVLMTILPFGLDDNNPVVEICLATMVPSLFIAIERTAILMQDPFENRPTDTPMTLLSVNIERNLMEMINVQPPARDLQTDSYYVM